MNVAQSAKHAEPANTAALARILVARGCLRSAAAIEAIIPTRSSRRHGRLSEGHEPVHTPRRRAFATRRTAECRESSIPRIRSARPERRRVALRELGRRPSGTRREALHQFDRLNDLIHHEPADEVVSRQKSTKTPKAKQPRAKSARTRSRVRPGSGFRWPVSPAWAWAWVGHSERRGLATWSAARARRRRAPG